MRLAVLVALVAIVTGALVVEAPASAQTAGWVQLGPFAAGGGPVSALYSPSSGVIYAATNVHLQISRNGGQSWAEHCFNECTNATDVQWLNVFGSTVYATSRGSFGGLFRSNDGGDHWVGLNTAGAFDSPDGVQLYLLTEAGMVYSPNSGATWQPTNQTPDSPRGGPLIAVGDEFEGAVLARNANLGLTRSVDKGATWAPTGVVFQGLSFLGKAADLVFFRGEGQFQEPLLMSFDFGGTWQRLGEWPTRISFIVADPTKPATFYVISGAQILQTQNFGQTWTEIPTAGLDGAPRLLAVDPTGTLYATTSSPNVFKFTAPESADLSLTMVGTPNPAVVGADLSYTISVRNAGPATATGVTIADTVPAGVDFVSATSGSCTPAAPPLPADRKVTCTVGSLQPNLTSTVTIHVKPNAQGTLTNSTSVSAAQADPDQSNNSASAFVLVNPAQINLGINGTSPAPLVFGHQVTYSALVTNQSAPPATNVTVIDNLPAQVLFDVASSSAGCSLVGSTIQCPIGDLAGGASKVVVVSGRITSLGLATNTMSVSGSQVDPVPTDNAFSTSSAVWSCNATPGLQVLLFPPFLTLIQTVDLLKVEYQQSFTFSLIGSGCPENIVRISPTQDPRVILRTQMGNVSVFNTGVLESSITVDTNHTLNAAVMPNPPALIVTDKQDIQVAPQPDLELSESRRIEHKLTIKAQPSEAAFLLGLAVIGGIVAANFAGAAGIIGPALASLLLLYTGPGTVPPSVPAASTLRLAPAPARSVAVTTSSIDELRASLAATLGAEFASASSIIELTITEPTRTPGQSVTYSAAGLAAGDEAYIVARPLADSPMLLQMTSTVNARGEIADLLQIPPDAKPGRWLMIAVDTHDLLHRIHEFAEGRSSTLHYVVFAAHFEVLDAPLPSQTGSIVFGGTTGFAEAVLPDHTFLNNWTVETWFKDEDPLEFNHDYVSLLNVGDRQTSAESPLVLSLGYKALVAGIRTGWADQTLRVDLRAAGLNARDWHHVALTFDRSTRALLVYVNGKLSGKRVLETTANVPASAIQFGRNGQMSGKYFHGKLDDVRMWQVVRTPEELAASYQQDLAGSTPGLVANWRFNDRSGSAATESVGRRDAVLHGNATFSADAHP